jgi:hypothetical protein
LTRYGGRLNLRTVGISLNWAFMSSRFDDRHLTMIVPMAWFLLRQGVELQPGLGRHPLVAQPQSERKSKAR